MTSIQVLDHGYVQLIERWGSDERIVEAARMSTAKGFKGWGSRCSCTIPDGGLSGEVSPDPKCLKCGGTGGHGDEKFLRYLWKHEHMSPFEMAGVIVEVQAPIFVFREWHRHRTQSYNEMSARYTVLPDLMYVPSRERLMAGKQSTKNKQGSDQGFTEDQAWVVDDALREAYADARGHYSELLSLGLARELARLVLPVAQYSRMRASANLRNWLAFLKLRWSADAQYEIRQYATALAAILRLEFPRTWALFEEDMLS